MLKKGYWVLKRSQRRYILRAAVRVLAGYRVGTNTLPYSTLL